MSQNIFTDGLGYEGKVTLTLKSNNRVLASKTYKNSGTAQLFKFLGLCLIDSFEEAKKLIPNKILLLNNTSAATPESADPTIVKQCSTWQTLAQLPTIVSESKTSQVKVVYSFEVPKAAIEGEFNQVALYGAGVEDIRDFSAYYYLVSPSGTFEAYDAEDWSATTVLLIEWELSIANKNVETNNRAEESE